MRSLLYTTGSPFARGVRIILDELALDYDRQEEITTPSAEQRAAATPTLQVPTLRDGEVVLCESGLIAEYLLSRYPERATADPPLAAAAWRAGSEWQDRLLLATVQTFGNAATTISQMRWTGVPLDGNAHLQRSAEKLAHVLGWLEERLGAPGAGFFPGALSVQDIFLASHVRFVQNRPLDVDLGLARYPRIAALLERLDARPSFQANPIRWWEPGVTGYAADGTPNRAGAG